MVASSSAAVKRGAWMAIPGIILSVAYDAVITEPNLKAASITRQQFDNAAISLRKKTGNWILAKRHLRLN